ncbi:kinetochore Sim4 complex subunit FTA2-domain-containing protein [Nemania sp. NC0429]|nr:kinetochore Sim4 complex subunit FTA2-domain-containing protein [Nemania sp. NC0429]
MAGMIPDMRGPKLHEFPGDIENIEFLKLLGPDERQRSPGEIPHGRVFLATIDGMRYAIKIFNFFSLDEIRPFVPGAEHLLTDQVVRYQLDPFYAECRAFGRLVETKKDSLLAVRCHGYAFLPAAVEQRITEQFGAQFLVADWNREPTDEGQPLRAIVKDYIRFTTTYGRKKLSTMRSNIRKLNELGVYNMDIREDNYRGGRLFDFSLAITSPHISLSLKLRSKQQIDEDVRWDLECLEELGENEVQRKENLKAAFYGKLRRRTLRQNTVTDMWEFDRST